MAQHMIRQWIDEEQGLLGMDWEEEICREGCAYARELAERRLEGLDDELMRSRPKGLRLVGSRQKTLVTRFGDVSIGQSLP